MKTIPRTDQKSELCNNHQHALAHMRNAINKTVAEFPSIQAWAKSQESEIKNLKQQVELLEASNDLIGKYAESPKIKDHCRETKQKLLELRK